MIDIDILRYKKIFIIRFENLNLWSVHSGEFNEYTPRNEIITS